MNGESINLDEKKLSNLTIKERKSRFNKLSNSLYIKLIKGDKRDIQYMVDCINKDENLVKRPVDLSNKNKCMAYCSELPLGILSYSSYTDLEKVKIGFPVVEKNEYNLLGTK